MQNYKFKNIETLIKKLAFEVSALFVIAYFGMWMSGSQLWGFISGVVSTFSLLAVNKFIHDWSVEEDQNVERVKHEKQTHIED